MKRIILAGFVLISVISIKAQTSQILPIDKKTGKVTYLEVVDAAGLNATEIFQVMRNWATEKGMEEVSSEGTEAQFALKLPVEYRDAHKSNFDKGVVNVAVYLMAKDGRYRYIFTDFIHEGKVCSGGDLAPVKPECPPSKMSLTGWTEIKKATRRKTTVLIEELKKLIKETKNDPTKNDDW